MLLMDLAVNNTQIFTGQPCFDRIFIQRHPYLQYGGGFFFQDTQGFSAPSYDGLNTRYLLIYKSEDGAALWSLPVQAVPNQSLTTILDNQNIAINLYEQTIDTAVPVGAALPTGADQGYSNQSFIAPQLGYAVPGYWASSYSV